MLYEYPLSQGGGYEIRYQLEFEWCHALKPMSVQKVYGHQPHRANRVELSGVPVHRLLADECTGSKLSNRRFVFTRNLEVPQKDGSVISCLLYTSPSPRD